MLTGWSVVLYVCSGSPGIQGVSQPLSHMLTLSPLLPWQHIFCMEIASLAVPTAHTKRGISRDLNVFRRDLSYGPTDWMKLSYGVLHAFTSNWLSVGAMEELSTDRLSLYVAKDLQRSPFVHSTFAE